ADWRVADAGAQKIKKGGSGTPSFALVENPDILATVAHDTARRPPLVVGFAAETEHVIEHAKAKLVRKGCDLIVANDVSRADIGFDVDRNEVVIVGPGAEDVRELAFAPKLEIAGRILDRVLEVRRR
ncbi:MAG: phosphopantothenoylcysteine decarboxylase, partial [Myxococcota bacterium]